MSMPSRNQLALRLIKALGLEGKKVHALTLRMGVNERVTVTAEIHPDAEQVAAMIDVLESEPDLPEPTIIVNETK